MARGGSARLACYTSAKMATEMSCVTMSLVGVGQPATPRASSKFPKCLFVFSKSQKEYSLNLQMDPETPQEARPALATMMISSFLSPKPLN